ncbi:hypothetical protein [Clostridium tagluense]|uniref:Rad50/SbcC-type AAA domain-containing protein n=1 Tax=Clostridium tagluense TaxID=360422 RepID=A0A401UP47_9CLOT|nr:hypothetical protein [Clostridium tagluense]GCD11312.1 hypothetical protein Ctaglu_29350 [Clostridium tagluense]
MGKKFKLIKLSLIGTRKNYEVIFKDGLNYISGPTSTGKTLILEMINYALGSEKHKSYIELGQSCTFVKLEIEIKDLKYIIKRKLFEFNEPVAVFAWDLESNKFKYLDRFDIDIPSNPKSLTFFLLEKLDLSNIKVAKQDFSFRDLFKYSYLKQTEIDNENIMGEKNWQTSIKRKPTFEIIFNIYDELLAGLKASLKVKNDELKESQTKVNSINEFLQRSEMMDFKTYLNKRSDVDKSIIEKQKELYDIKITGNIKEESTLELQNKILKLKNQCEKLGRNIIEQTQYVNKLILLKNQYISEISKIDFIVEGYHALNRFDYVICPSCLQSIDIDVSSNKCNLCGKEKIEPEIEEILSLKHDKKTLIKKNKELGDYIQNEELNLELMMKECSDLKNDLFNSEKELLHLHKHYINPLMERIEQLNYEIGEANRIITELESNHKMLIELDRIKTLCKDKEKSVEDLKDKIRNTESTVTDKEDVIKNLSEQLTKNLIAFDFPKLENSYIDGKTYLPHVRERLYSELGSLAGVTLITMAYYLAIAICANQETFNHLGLIIIDSPRKNLGADSKEKTFKDEEIFNSIVSFLIEVDKEYRTDIQFVVVNNGYPIFLNKNDIIKEFDGDGRKGLPYGMIDDIQG